MKNILAEKDIRFAFFDIDGTIMNAAHQVSAETKRALVEFRARGADYGLASGRPYFGAKHLIDQLQVKGVCVFFSGALVVHASTGESLLEETLSAEESAQILAFARREELYVEAYTREDYFIDEPSRLADIHSTYLGKLPQLRPLEAFSRTEKILKFVFVTHSRAEEAKIQAFSKLNPQLGYGFGYGAAHPGILFANVTSLKASREAAFARAIAHLGLPAEKIAAFGDAEADIPFLMMSGLGVAMGNAPQAVQDAAHVVTATVEEDGVAKVLDQIGPRAG